MEFETSISYPYDQSITSLCETPNRDYIAVGQRFFGSGSTDISGIAIKLDSMGNVLKTVTIQDTMFYISLIEVVRYDNKYLALGMKQQRFAPLKDSLIIYVFDDDLNILFRQADYLLDTNGITRIQCRFMDNAFYFSVNTRCYLSGVNLRNRIWLYEMDTLFNITNKKEITAISTGMNLEYFSKSYGDSRVAFISTYNSLSLTSAVILGDSLELDTFINLPVDFYKRFYFIKSYPDSSSLFLSMRSQFSGSIYRFCLVRFSNTFQTTDSITIEPFDTHQVVPTYQYSSKGDSTFFIASTFNANKYNLHFGGFGARSWIRLLKMDDSLNILFDTLIGDNKYYLLQSMIETSDGGCLLSATSYEYYSNPNMNRDIVIIKIGPFGNTSWVKNITKPESLVRVFPNPTTDLLNISLTTQNETIELIQLFDMQGRVVFSQDMNEIATQIDVGHLPSGIYLLEGLTAKGQRFVGKFVKE
ncbi:MAG: T9SS type A sorting domain-containing protein [Bacteroidales bacterium]|nr:T9SS type A sorting domain-containing protein [Bacteroidales bacterium]